MRAKKETIITCAQAALIFAILLLLSSPIFTAQGAFVFPSDNLNLLITEIYPNSATKNELDEYLAITNSGARSINIAGWSITDDEGTLTFSSFAIAPGQTIYVTRTASAFANTTNISPDFEYYSDSDPEVNQMQKEGKAFVLRNSGDEVILQDKHGRCVDVVIYGDSSYNREGWQGKPLKKPREGLFFKRIQDTNRCDDWVLLPIGTSYHAPEKISISGEVTAFVSPDCSYSILQREIDNASGSLYINLYQFENPYLMDLVLNAIDREVAVKLLLEAKPVGGIKDEELYIAEKIEQRGGEVRFSDDPFINHAKYAIVDNETTIVMTENWKNSGVPYNNSFGNRGWGVVIKNVVVSAYFKELFLDDFYRGNEFGTEICETKGFFMAREIPQGSYKPVFMPLTVGCNFTVIPVLAPDTAISNETTLGMINNAKESVFVQQFSTGRFWGEEDNLFIAALIEAARRGCEVKVLLDSKYLEGGNNNDEVVSWLSEVSKEENLNLEAKLADLESLGLLKIHNKGLIVDGKKVLISSLNWNANSIHNREAGLILENEKVALFYEGVFCHDWNVSAKGIQEENTEGDCKTDRIMKIVGVIVTLIVSYVIFRVVKWYKRI